MVRACLAETRGQFGPPAHKATKTTEGSRLEPCRGYILIFVDIQELQSGSLKAVINDVHEPLQEFITQLVVIF